MKDLSDPYEILKNLKYTSKKGGIEALNYMLTQHRYVSSSRRNYYLQYFIQEKISSVMFVDRQKLEELEMVRRTGREEKEVIPHSRISEDLFDLLISAMQKSKRENFFEFERNLLFLIADEKCRKPVEKVLKEMGLKIIYFRGIL